MAEGNPEIRPAAFYQRVAGEYDREPHESFYRRVAGELAGRLPEGFQPGSILEVGAGTGFSTAVFRSRFPGAAITAIEPSTEMLSRAGGRVDGVSWVCGPLSRYSGGGSELVLASMSYHWLDGAERKKLAELAATGVLGMAVPVAGGGGRLDGNRELKLLATQMNGGRNWPRETRRPCDVRTFLASHFSDIREFDLEIHESYGDRRELARSLHVRGVFYALFGDAAGTAREMFSRGNGARPEFSWSVKIFVAGNGDGAGGQAGWELGEG